MTASWPSYPKNDAEFESLMAVIDQTLSEQGLKPWQRPLHVGLKLWEAYKWSGNAFPKKELAQAPGFSGDILMAKAHRWYEQTYADRLNSEWAHGFAPVRLGNTLWRVRAGIVYGRVRFFVDRNLKNRGSSIGAQGTEASLNVLCDVEGLPQGLIDRLSNQTLSEHLEFHVFVQQNLQWRDSLPPTGMLDIARADYDESTSSVLAGRFGQARWGAQQSMEKTLKGLLSIAGTPFPTGGPKGHDLKGIADLLEVHHGIALNSTLLAMGECSPRVRYGEEPSTEEQALVSNHAVLAMLDQLRLNPKAGEILKKYSKRPANPS